MNTSIHRRWGAKLVLVLSLAAIASLAGMPAAATSSIAHLVFSPSPIGDAATVSPGSTVSVRVTAEDANKAALAGVQVWLSFNQTLGGGTAFVGSTPLRPKATQFITDSSGNVTFTYTSPGIYPTTSGVDVVHAKNAATRSSATAFSADSFCFSPIASMAFEPRPVARDGTLAGNLSVPVTLTVFDSHGNRMVGTPVNLSFKPTTGGGTATVNGVSLSTKPALFNTNSNGQIVVTYKTPTTVPTLGTDVLIAADAPNNPCVRDRDSYSF